MPYATVGLAGKEGDPKPYVAELEIPVPLQYGTWVDVSGVANAHPGPTGAASVKPAGLVMPPLSARVFTPERIRAALRLEGSPQCQAGRSVLAGAAPSLGHCDAGPTVWGN